MFQKRIRRRIPFFVINTVEDALQIGLPLAQHAIEAATQFLRRNLARISRADGGDGVSKDNPGFQAVAQTVKLNALWAEVAPRQIRKLKLVRGEKSLISQVMDGQADARDTSPPFPFALMPNKSGTNPVCHSCT